MNNEVTITQQPGPVGSPPQEQHEARKGTAKPALEWVIAAIRLDAADDPLSFLLRSDTGHDGE